jgi:PAS domain S-box-containing protein
MTGRTRVLLVEDVDDIRRTTTLALDHAGFEVIEAADGATALARFDSSIDVVLLDRGLPDLDGISLIPRLRERRDAVHIMIVSALGTEAERVEGLLAGADDYLVKPASMAELIARVTAAARRLERGRSDVLHFDELAIDLDRRLVLRSGEPIDLTRQEFDLLGHLARNPERAVTREELLEAAWTSSCDWQSTATVTEHVRRVRNKVERDPTNPRWIESVRGVGYRFKAPSTNEHIVKAAPRIPTVMIDGTRIVHASDHALSLLGASSAVEIVGRDVASLVAPRSVGALSARQATADAGRWPRPEIITLVRLDGREVHVEVSTTPVEWDGRPVRQATLWPLEGRTERLRALVTGVGADVTDAVIITDVHLRVESFNTAAEELYGCREADVIGRRITDVIPWVGDTSDLLAAADALERNDRWHGPVQQRRADGRTVDVLATTTMLRDDAGRAVGVVSVNRSAPSNGHGEPEDEADDAALAAAIVRGVERDEFEVVFQPIVRLSDRTTTGVEALVRWDHPTRGRLSPIAFIGAAERTGVIVELGAHVLHRACAQLGRWREAGHDIHLAVNLSARQLADERISEDVARVMFGHRFGPDVLWLEVTESALVEDLDVAATRLHELRDLGARISIDDFGTGWASLTYLHRFPIDALKVDSVFVKGLGDKPSATAIVRSIVSLGQELDMAVVAEGIETEQQLRALRSLGCTVGQGYLFAEPGSASAVRLAT